MQRSILALFALAVVLPCFAQAPARPPLQTTKVEQADGVYIGRRT